MRSSTGKRFRALAGMILLMLFFLCAPAAAEYVCGQEEHVHTRDCYAHGLHCVFEPHTHSQACVEGELYVCGLTEDYRHVHDSVCYDGDMLICPLAEQWDHVHDLTCYRRESVLVCDRHVHDQECRVWVQGPEPVCGLEEQPGHVHGEDCYVQALMCGQEESGHVHDESCLQWETVLVCDLDHAHDMSCYEQQALTVCGMEEGHRHGPDCYMAVLVCMEEEREGHTHSEECYSGFEILICGEEDHEHSGDCYETRMVLVCRGAGEHVHTEECYESGVCVCGYREMPVHVHGEDCLSDGESELICGKAEHVHGPECEDVLTEEELEAGTEEETETTPEEEMVPEAFASAEVEELDLGAARIRGLSWSGTPVSLAGRAEGSILFLSGEEAGYYRRMTEALFPAGEDSAYLMMRIDVRCVNAREFAGFEARVILPQPLVGRGFRLYHISENEEGMEEARIVENTRFQNRILADGQEELPGFTFSADRFGPFVLAYREAETVRTASENTWAYDTQGQGSWQMDQDGTVVIRGSGTLGSWADTDKAGRVRYVMVTGEIQKIGEDAFRGFENLREVRLADLEGLEEIESGAFSDCPVLERIDLRGCRSLKSIGDEAFLGDSRLRDLDLSDCRSLERIGGRALGDTALSTLTLPESLVFVAGNAFSDMRDLRVLRWNVRNYGKEADPCWFSGGLDLVIGRDVECLPPLFLSGIREWNSIAFEGVNEALRIRAGELSAISPSLEETEGFFHVDREGRLYQLENGTARCVYGNDGSPVPEKLWSGGCEYSVSPALQNPEENRELRIGEGAAPILEKRMVNRSGAEMSQPWEDLVFSWTVFEYDPAMETMLPVWLENGRDEDALLSGFPGLCLMHPVLTLPRDMSCERMILEAEGDFSWTPGKTYVLVEDATADFLGWQGETLPENREVLIWTMGPERETLVSESLCPLWTLEIRNLKSAAVMDRYRLREDTGQTGEAVTGVTLMMEESPEDYTDEQGRVWAYVDTLQAGEEGRLVWTGLEGPSYLVRERPRTRSGFPEERVFDRRDADRLTRVLKEGGESEAYELPATGGKGTSAVKALGLCLMLACVAGFVKQRGRKRKA